MLTSKPLVLLFNLCAGMLMLFTSYPAESKQQESPTPSLTADLQQSYSLLNSFSSYRQYLSFLKSAGIITEAELKGVEQLFLAKNMNLDAPILKAQVDKNTVRFNRIHLRIDANGEVFGQNGIKLNFQASKPFDSELARIVNDLLQKPVASNSLLTFLLPRAHADAADGPGGIADVLSGALGFVWHSVFAALSTAVTASCALPSVPFDLIIQTYVGLTTDGAVKCRGDEYIYEFPKSHAQLIADSWSAEYDKKIDHSPSRYRFRDLTPPTISEKLDAATSANFAAFCSQPWLRSAKSRVAESEVQRSLYMGIRQIGIDGIGLGKMLNKALPRKCDSETAQQVTFELRAQYKRVFAHGMKSASEQLPTIRSGIKVAARTFADVLRALANRMNDVVSGTGDRARGNEIAR